MSELDKAYNAYRELTKANKTFIPCPECGIGTFGGIFDKCCNNKNCVLYNDYYMDRCRVCNVVRRECCC